MSNPPLTLLLTPERTMVANHLGPWCRELSLRFVQALPTQWIFGGKHIEHCHPRVEVLACTSSTRLAAYRWYGMPPLPRHVVQRKRDLRFRNSAKTRRTCAWF
jgi:hypothetical protein